MKLRKPSAQRRDRGAAAQGAFAESVALEQDVAGKTFRYTQRGVQRLAA